VCSLGSSRNGTGAGTGACEEDRREQAQRVATAAAEHLARGSGPEGIPRGNMHEALRAALQCSVQAALLLPGAAIRLPWTVDRSNSETEGWVGVDVIVTSAVDHRRSRGSRCLDSEAEDAASFTSGMDAVHLDEDEVDSLVDSASAPGTPRDADGSLDRRSAALAEGGRSSIRGPGVASIAGRRRSVESERAALGSHGRRPRPPRPSSAQSARSDARSGSRERIPSGSTEPSGQLPSVRSALMPALMRGQSHREFDTDAASPSLLEPPASVLEERSEADADDNYRDEDGRSSKSESISGIESKAITKVDSPHSPGSQSDTSRFECDTAAGDEAAQAEAKAKANANAKTEQDAMVGMPISSPAAVLHPAGPMAVSSHEQTTPP